MHFGKVLLYFIFLQTIITSSFAQTREERNVFDNLSRSFEYKTIKLNIYNSNFLVDNEYKGLKVSGYTLPGFRLTPTVSYTPNKKIMIEGGVSILHYWGANKYPCTVYSHLPDWESYQYMNGLHLVPYFRAIWLIDKDMLLSFGNVYNFNSHLLNEVLYNYENTFNSDPELGAQFIMDKKHFYMDLWLNWQSFVFDGDIHQESFTIGCATETRFHFANDKFSITFPLNVIIQHLGGENLDIKHDVQSWLNASVGLKTTYRFNPSASVSLGGETIGYKNLSGNDLFPFDKGWGIYPYISFRYNELEIKTAYFESEDFVSLLGSQHFCNFSSNTEDLLFDRNSQIYAKASYHLKIGNGYNLNLIFQLFRQNELNGYRTGYGSVKRKGFTSFTLGVVFNINPSIKLKTI